MRVQNGTVWKEDASFEVREVYCDGDRIAAEPGGGEEIFDASGCIVAPGFIDIHIHGAVGVDFCDASAASNAKMSAYLASVGVTSYLGTTMALPEDQLQTILGVGREAIEKPGDGAVMRGVNLEGPFAAAAKKGAMVEEYLIPPSVAAFERLNEASGDHILFCDVAPELPGGMQVVEEAARHCRVSLAHSAADYALASEGFRAGASHVTHLFNAMAPFHHRDPGTVGAAADFAEFAELISDGIHIHPSMVRAAFRLFGEDRVCLISDSMMACGMPNGTYELGGQAVQVVDGAATLANGTLAGSATPLSECFRRAVKDFGVPLVAALKAVTANPARAIGMDDEIGGIAPGKRADLTILGAETLQVVACVVGGKLFRKA